MSWWVADISGQGGFSSGIPRQLIEGPYVNSFGISYDVGSDGRVLLMRDAQDRLRHELRVVTNWLSELRARAGNE